MLVSGPMCLVLGTLAGSLEGSIYYVRTFVYDIISQLPMIEWYLLFLNCCSTEWICVQCIAFNLPWYISLSQPIVLEYIASANHCVLILSLSLPLCHTHTYTPIDTPCVLHLALCQLVNALLYLYTCNVSMVISKGGASLRSVSCEIAKPP